MLTSEEYYKQAAMTAHGWMAKAVHSIDELFEPGFAKAHPELVGAFMQTCAIEFHGSFAVQGLTASVNSIASSLDK